jgi:SAM-dependent methyltransferase
LLARGATVTAIEPGGQLAAILRERHGNDVLTVVESELENAALPDEAFDLAVAATSWHWIDAAAALPRLAKALRPHGGLAIWWTIFGPADEPQTEFRTQLDGLYSRYMPNERDDGLPRKPMRIKDWTEQIQHGGWFESPEVEMIRWTQHLTPESAQALWGTFPNVNELNDVDRSGFLDGVSAAVDSLGGSVDDPSLTIIYYTRRTAS